MSLDLAAQLAAIIERVFFVGAGAINVVLSGHACPADGGCLVRTTTLSAAMGATNTHATPERVKPSGPTLSRWPGGYPA